MRRYNNIRNILLVISFLFLMVSCSSNDTATNLNPVVPDIDLTAQDNPVVVEDSVSVTSLWGLFDIIIDPESKDVEILPIRGAEFTFNVTQFLQNPIGDPSNLGISIHDASNYVSQGLIDVDVSVTHPFPTAESFAKKYGL